MIAEFLSALYIALTFFWLNNPSTHYFITSHSLLINPNCIISVRNKWTPLLCRHWNTYKANGEYELRFNWCKKYISHDLPIEYNLVALISHSNSSHLPWILARNGTSFAYGLVLSYFLLDRSFSSSKFLPTLHDITLDLYGGNAMAMLYTNGLY